MPGRVGLIVDNPLRDLQGTVLIARELANRGLEAILVPMYQQGVDVPLLKLDALLLNYARLNNLELMRAYHKLNLALFVLDTEGGVLSQNGLDAPQNWAGLVKNSGIGELVSGYFFWGKRVQQAFCEFSGIAPDKLHVTGQPRYDVCSRRWRAMLTHPRTDYILINTNFSAVNPLYTETIQSEKKIFESNGWDAHYIDSLCDELSAVFERFLAEIKKLIQANPRLNFVIRPHPFENRSRYDHLFENEPNAVVDPSGSIFNVIHHARCVLHLNCGTSVEANLLEKVPLSLEYLNTNVLRRHTPLPSQISYRAGSFEQLNRAVNSISDIAGTFDFKGLFRSHIQPWFHEVDGGAAEKVAGFISEFIERNPKNTSRISLKASLKSCRVRPGLMQFVQAITANLLGSEAGARLRHTIWPQRRLKYFNAADVNQILGDFAAAEERTKNYSARHVRHPLTGVALASVRLSHEAGNTANTP